MATHATQANDKRDWGLFFGGLLVVLCGIAALFWPGATMEILALVAGVGFLVAGVFSFATWVRTHKYAQGSGWTLANAICDIILGIMFLVHPVVGAGVITMVVGCFTLAYGFFAIVTSFGIRKMTSSWWIMLLNGIISVMCGWFFLFSPGFFAIFLAVFIIMQGVTMSTYGIAPSSRNPY